MVTSRTSRRASTAFRATLASSRGRSETPTHHDARINAPHAQRRPAEPRHVSIASSRSACVVPRHLHCASAGLCGPHHEGYAHMSVGIAPRSSRGAIVARGVGVSNASYRARCPVHSTRLGEPRLALLGQQLLCGTSCEGNIYGCTAGKWWCVMRPPLRSCESESAKAVSRDSNPIGRFSPPNLRR